MKSFDWTRLNKKIALQANLPTIYNAWTTAGELEKWFLRGCIFMDRNNNVVTRNQNVTAGNNYSWTWYLYEETEQGRILEANGKDHLRFSFAGECIVDVKLIEREKDIIVDLTQSNIPTDDYSRRHIRLGCDSGWAFFLVNLKSFYENGKDLRNKNPTLKGMVNN